MYNGILAIKKNEIMPFAATWQMYEATHFIQSEVCLIEKDKYYIILHIDICAI